MARKLARHHLARGRLRAACAAASAALLGLGGAPVCAGDRPFQRLTTAAAEEDDDRVWSVDTSVERLGPVHALAAQAEYAFDPTTSVQLGYGLAHESRTGARSQAFETEAKRLFNHIARDGYGWGLALSHAFGKAPEEGWRGGNWTLTLPASLQLGSGPALVHANLGWSKARGQASERLLAIGAEVAVLRHAALFGELAREGDETYVNLGVRHWLRRERLAFDVSLQRARGNGARTSGLVVGLSWYDL